MESQLKVSEFWCSRNQKFIDQDYSKAACQILLMHSSWELKHKIAYHIIRNPQDKAYIYVYWQILPIINTNNKPKQEQNTGFNLSCCITRPEERLTQKQKPKCQRIEVALREKEGCSDRSSELQWSDTEFRSSSTNPISPIVTNP